MPHLQGKRRGLVFFPQAKIIFTFFSGTKGLYIILPVLGFFSVLSQKFCFSCAFRQSLLAWQDAWLFGKDVLNEVMHKKFLFNEDLNKLVRLGLDGRGASE